MQRSEIRVFERDTQEGNAQLVRLSDDCGHEIYGLRNAFRLAMALSPYYYETHQTQYGMWSFARVMATTHFLDREGNPISEGRLITVTDHANRTWLLVKVLAKGENEVIYESGLLNRVRYILKSTRRDDLYLDELSPTAVKRLAKALDLPYNEESWGCPIPKEVSYKL